MTRQFAAASLGRFGCLVVALTMGLVSGCDKGSGLELYPVTGTLTDNGEPIPDADITFNLISKAEGNVPRALGTTDASGKFELKTADGEMGALAGDYDVFVSYGGTMPPELSEDDNMEAPVPMNVVPPTDYHLKATVRADGENVLDLDIKDGKRDS